MKIFFSLSLILALSLTNCHPASREETKDFSHFFDEYHVEGAFVLYDLQQDQYIRYNPGRCNQPIIPASTFKIFNSLVSILKELNIVD